MTYHEITVVDLKMHPTPMYLLQTGSSSVYSTIYSQVAILAVKRRQNPLSWTGSEYCNFWSMKRCMKCHWSRELPSRALIWSRQKPKGAFPSRNHGTYRSTPAQPPRTLLAGDTTQPSDTQTWKRPGTWLGASVVTMVTLSIFTPLDYCWHLRSWICDSHVSSCLLPLAGVGGFWIPLMITHTYTKMDSIILLRCSTVPGFNVVWIPSQRSVWGISITYSAFAIRKSKA